MIYEFNSYDIIAQLNRLPESDKLVKFVEKVTMADGEIAQLQIVLTKRNTEFVSESGRKIIIEGEN